MHSQLVVVIIVGYYSKEHLRRCFESVFSQEYRPIEVVYINNSPADASHLWVKKEFPSVTVINNSSNSGYVGGNNKGIEYAINIAAKYVFIINPDVYLESCCLKNLVLAANNQEGIYQPLLLYPDRTIQTSGNNLHFLGFGSSGKKDFADIIDVSFCSGAALFFPTSIPRKIGLFWPLLFCYHEDLEYCARAKLAGYSTRLVPSAKGIHDHLFKSRHGKKFYFMERNRFLFVMAYFDMIHILLFLPFFIIAEIIVLFHALLNDWLADKIEANLDAVKLLAGIKQHRKIIRRLSKVPFSELSFMMSGRIDFPNPSSKFVQFGIFCSSISWNLFSRLINNFFSKHS
ncbi:MAG: glycosyltransferase family 2 protein [Candidatus Riflebacteria bacterium]|nr:glycosyltransferase family 2 protein [Candidatus Riflebacteria bacterium]